MLYFVTVFSEKLAFILATLNFKKKNKVYVCMPLCMHMYAKVEMAEEQEYLWCYFWLCFVYLEYVLFARTFKFNILFTACLTYPPAPRHTLPVRLWTLLRQGLSAQYVWEIIRGKSKYGASFKHSCDSYINNLQLASSFTTVWHQLIYRIIFTYIKGENALLLARTVDNLVWSICVRGCDFLAFAYVRSRLSVLCVTHNEEKMEYK